MSDAELAVLPDVMPVRNAVVEIAEFDAELVVFDPRAHRVHLLQGTMALVLDACDGETAADAVVGEFVDALGVSEAEVRAALGVALAELAGLGLLEGTEPLVPPPCLGCQEEPTPRPRARLARWRLFRS